MSAAHEGSSRVSLVTGAGSGIGRAVAIALLQAGDRVVLAGRRRAPLEETAELSGVPRNALPAPADIGDPAQVEALFALAARTYGRLDLLFNNAGRSGPPVALEDVSFEDWQSVVGVNLTGMFLCTQAAFRLMKAQTPQGGRIINNGSISAHTPRPRSAPYTATKHAVTGLTKATALDGRAYNIACGQIDIGNASTDMTERMSRGVPQADGRLAPEPTMPVGDVAKAVLTMADLPLGTNVLTMTVMATAMPFVGRG